MIRLHDLRHTHATLLLADREPVKTVSERDELGESDRAGRPAAEEGQFKAALLARLE